MCRRGYLFVLVNDFFKTYKDIQIDTKCLSIRFWALGDDPEGSVNSCVCQNLLLPNKILLFQQKGEF